jgi:hypothetical protein
LSGERERDYENQNYIFKIRKTETDKTDVGHIEGRKQKGKYSTDFD